MDTRVLFTLKLTEGSEDVAIMENVSVSSVVLSESRVMSMKLLLSDSALKVSSNCTTGS